MPTKAVQAAEGKVAVRAEAGLDGGRLMFVWPVSVTARLSVADKRASLQFSRGLDGDAAPAMRQLAEWLSGLEAGPATNGLTLHLRDGVGARLAAFHPRLTVVELYREQKAPVFAGAAEAAASTHHGFIPIPVSRPAMETTATPSTDGAVAATGTAAGEAAARDGYPRSIAPADGAPTKVTISSQARPHGVELRFDWNAPVPAAVFQHRDELWLVFGAAGADVAGWRSLQRPDLAAWLEPKTSRNAGQVRLFRLKLNRPADVSVLRESTSWIVQVTAAADMRPPMGFPAILRRDAEAGTLQAMVDGQVAQLNDPETGERIGVLLTARADVLQPMPVKLVDLELLASAQGLAWRPLADGVRGRVEADRFLLTRRGGLHLSPAAADVEADQAAPSAPSRAEQAADGRTDEPAERASPESGTSSAPLGLGALAQTSGATRQRARHDLVATLAGLRGTPRILARLELARLYLADALGPEAGTALELVPAEALAGPTLDRLRQSRAALAGAAAALSGRVDTALAILLDRLLDQDQEVALWRAYAAARAMRSELAAQELERSNGALDHYPTPLRRVLGLELASTLLDRGEAGPALALLDRLRPLDLPPNMEGRLHLLAGLAMDKAERPADAEREFQAAAAMGDLDTRTRAAFLRIAVPAARGMMPAATAAEAMMPLRAGWRGHPWETTMLRRLAELQSGAGRDDDALATLEVAAENATDRAEEAAIRSDIGGRLQRLLQADDAIERAPVASLARYRSYGHYLTDRREDTALRAQLARSAAASGMFTTADTLLGPRPAAAAFADYAAARLDIARAEAASGDIPGALGRLTPGGDDIAGVHTGAAALRGELRARLALDAGDPVGAAVALEKVPAGTVAPLRRRVLLQTGDWAALAQSAAADLTIERTDAAAGPATAEAAVWLGLAQAQLGRPDLAAAVADRYGGGADREAAALLRLATTLPEEPTPRLRLPAVAGAFADRLRAALDELPAAPRT